MNEHIKEVFKKNNNRFKEIIVIIFSFYYDIYNDKLIILMYMINSAYFKKINKQYILIFY